MYKKIKDGKKVVVQGLECYTPPVGFGSRFLKDDSGAEIYEIVPVEIIKHSNIAKEQFWQPFLLPENWEDLLEAEREERRKLKDDDYSDVELDKIREREWKRRLFGIWVYIEGSPVYITGAYYFYLNYWQLDTGLPDFREIDLEYFYFWQYCLEDPKCYGLIEICKRRNGKTARASSIIYEVLSRTERALGGMQSMNEGAARDIFDLHLIPAFQQLPEFFIPIYDTSKGSTPKGELLFQLTSVKGKNAFQNLKKKQLKSRINFKDSKPKAYDGKKTIILILDESGKVEHDVITRHLVVKKCLVNAKRQVVGKMIVTTTVEEMGIKFRFNELWQWSDQNKRESDGQTKSGLYKFFIPADRSGGYDIYGKPYVAETRAAILAERAKLVNNTRDLFGEIRKEPLSEEEAFKVSNDECHFNQILLENVHSTLIWSGGKHWLQGNIDWIKGIPINQPGFEGVEFNETKQGKWWLRKGFEVPINAFTTRGNSFYPNNSTRFASACDPYQLDVTEDIRNSKLSAHIKQRFSPNGEDCPYNKCYVLRYYYRQKLVSLSHEDMIKQCLFIGCDILIENAKDGGMIKTFKNSGMGAFLQCIKGKENEGVYPDENNKNLGLGLLNDYIEKYLAFDYYKLLHPLEAEQLIKFNVQKTEKTDTSMSLMWTEVADFYKTTKIKKVVEYTEYTDFIPSYLLI